MSLLNFILPEVGAILKLFIKNPNSLSGLKGVLTEIAADIQVILAGMS